MRLQLINFLKFLLGVKEAPPIGCSTCPHHVTLNKNQSDGTLGTFAQAKGIHGTHYEFDQIPESHTKSD